MSRALVLLLAMGLVACGSDGAPAGDTLAPVDVSIEGEWRAVSATVDGGEVPDLDRVTVTMTIAAGRATGSSGCNSYDQAVEIAGGAIEFGVREVSEAGCTDAPGEIESLFRQLTSGSVAWSIDGDVLTLTAPTAVWVFERWTFTTVMSTTIASTSPATSVQPSPAASIEVRPVVDCSPADGERPAPDPELGQAVLPLPDDEMTCLVGRAVAPQPVFAPGAVVTFDATGTWVVGVQVRDEARTSWDESTAACFERVEPCASGRLAIVLDGSIVTAPAVMQAVLPEVQIQGDFTKAKASAIATAINGATTEPSGSPLQGHWRAVTASVDGIGVPDLDTVAVTMAISGDRVSGLSGCNDYDRDVRIERDTISFGESAPTEAPCTAAPGEIERLFSGLLAGTLNWSVSDDIMMLASPTSIWVFEAA